MKRTLLLPDVNVWIAMTFDSHPHHPAAKLWFDAVSDDMFFCRMTQQGFLRLSTNPSVAGVDALTITEAWQKYDEYLTDPRIAFATEPAGLESQGEASRRAAPSRRVSGMTRISRHSRWPEATNWSCLTRGLRVIRACRIHC